MTLPKKMRLKKFHNLLLKLGVQYGGYIITPEIKRELATEIDEGVTERTINNYRDFLIKQNLLSIVSLERGKELWDYHPQDLAFKEEEPPALVPQTVLESKETFRNGKSSEESKDSFRNGKTFFRNGKSSAPNEIFNNSTINDRVLGSTYVQELGIQEESSKNLCSNIQRSNSKETFNIAPTTPILVSKVANKRHELPYLNKRISTSAIWYWAIQCYRLYQIDFMMTSNVLSKKVSMYKQGITHSLNNDWQEHKAYIDWYLSQKDNWISRIAYDNRYMSKTDCLNRWQRERSFMPYQIVESDEARLTYQGEWIREDDENKV